MAGANVLLEDSGKFDTIHSWHHDVADDDVGNVFQSQGHAFLTVLRLENLEVVAERVGDVLTNVGIVLDDEECGPGSLGRFEGFKRFERFEGFEGFDGGILLVQSIGIGVFDGNGENKPTALTLTTFGNDGAFVQIGQRTHKGETDACARSLMTSLGLIVALEDVRQRIGGNAMSGITHGDMQHSLGIALDIDSDVALFGVLDGVGKQVVEDGGDYLRIEINLGKIGRDVVGELHLGIAI